MIGAAQILLFVHLLGVVLWVGSFITYPFWTRAAKRRGGEAVAFAYQSLVRINTFVTIPGYWLATAGGIGLIVVSPQYHGVQPIWLVFMEVAGIVLFLLALVMFDRRQRQLARLAAGDDQAAFKAIDRQHAITASVAGVLMLAIIAVATIKPL
ncbi:MAG TPA: DUF2269 family protein [Chloroflexota bacterium]|jgi:uncharacterized membrane protein|nr:DUF2269 family protein [Chloroflexota bacterium]